MFRQERSTLAETLRKKQIEFSKQPLSPVKQAILKALFDYGIELIEQRGLLSLAFTNFEERAQNILTISNFIQYSDDQFISETKKYLSNHLTDPTSSLRRNLITTLQEVESNLQSRRKDTKMAIGAGLLLIAWSTPVLGIPALILFAMNSHVSNEILEFYDHSKLEFTRANTGRETPCPEIHTTYHRCIKK